MTKRSTSTRSVRRIPQRTCLACRQVKNKQELIRIVRASDGSVEVDISGKKAGRGTYLCPLRACWETGLKGNRLEHTLRATLTRDNRGRLIEFGKNFYRE